MSEHGMSCHDCGIMSMYDMTWNLHERHAGVIIHVQRGHGGLLGGQVWGGLFSIKKVVASILTNSFILFISIIFLKCDVQDLGACVDPKEEEDAQNGGWWFQTMVGGNSVNKGIHD